MTQLTKKLMYLNHVITDYLAVKLWEFPDENPTDKTSINTIKKWVFSSLTLINLCLLPEN